MPSPLPTAQSVLATAPLDSHDAALRDFGARRLKLRTALLFVAYASIFALLAFTPLLPMLIGVRLGWLWLAFASAPPAAFIAVLVARQLTPQIAARVERDHDLEPGALGLEQFVIR